MIKWLFGLLSPGDRVRHIARQSGGPPVDLITPAAEVGDQVIWEMWREGDIKDKQDVINATIERCAQVAEMMHEREFRGNAIAAAIRALKDKP